MQTHTSPGPEGLDIDHLKSWIGREDAASELLTPVLVARLLATLDRTGSVTEGAEAPLLVHHCLGQALAPTSELGPDGHPPRGGFLPPVPLPRRMWAGGAIDFHRAPRIGETVTRSSVIRDVSVKHGRSGTLCFVTVGHEVSASGSPILSERQDIVYRAAPDAKPAAPETETKPAAPAPAPEGTHRRLLAASPELLFRYSAITFNSHRIHYDMPYVTGEEGYPGLVVHGPLQAMLLVNHAADVRGAPPARFSFRSKAPAFGGGDLTLNATEAEGGLDLWTAAPGGPVAMEARAEW